jgi:putative transposase
MQNFSSMARKLRVEWSGACYHVINRGNYRRDLFLVQGAAASFETCLFEAAGRFCWRLHAYVVMGNHFHLAVETPEPNLSDGMQWLQATWAARFNRFRGETGRPFQGRFKALHVEPGHALAQVAHYIHLNPVRATLVTIDRLTDYPWSSLRRFAAEDRPKVLVADTVLRESCNLADTAAGWRSYLEYLALVAEEDTKLREKQFGRFSRGWAIGSAQFKADLRKELAGRPGDDDAVELRGADGAAHREMRSQLWEEALLRLAQELKIDLTQLPAPKSAEPKVRLAAAMKATTSVSNGWLAERLALGPAASVSQYVRRFRVAGSVG